MKIAKQNIMNQFEESKEYMVLGIKDFPEMVAILDKNFPKNECKERGAAMVMLAEIRLLLRNRNENKIILEDLLRIADEGEYEDMRREIEDYFKNKIT